MAGRCYRRYRGVAIYRVETMVTGSDYYFDDNGILCEQKPQFEVAFQYTEGYPCDTLDECKEMIDDCLNNCRNDSEMMEIMVDTLNSELV